MIGIVQLTNKYNLNVKKCNLLRVKKCFTFSLTQKPTLWANGREGMVNLS